MWNRLVSGMIAATLALLATPALAQNAQNVSTWDRVMSTKVLRVGFVQAVPWFDKDPVTGKWTGLCAEISKRMAADLGVRLEEVEVTFGNSIAALQAGRIDMMPCLDANPQRAVAIDFTAEHVLWNSIALLVDDGFAGTTWDDLNKPDVSIAVTQGTGADDFITRRLPRANILRFPTNAETVAALQSRRAGVAVSFFPPLMILQKQMGRGKIIQPKPTFSSPSMIGVRREGDKTFRDWVNAAAGWYYKTQQVQIWFEEYLASAGFDPKQIPPVVREQ
jgi:polar amino acid transport system substrate-binding protein